jgi:hypothetical protein
MSTWAIAILWHYCFFECAHIPVEPVCVAYLSASLPTAQSRLHNALILIKAQLWGIALDKVQQDALVRFS